MADSLKFAVCDDMPTERRIMVHIIEKYLDRHQYVVSIDEYSSGQELLETDVTEYQLVFLDIYMKELSGIETAKELVKRNPGMKIIFCSSSNEFAAESYDVDAFRYFTKPLSEEKIFSSLDKYFNVYTSMQMLEYKSDRLVKSVLLSEVLWLEAWGKKCIIHTKNGDYETTTSLAEFSKTLADKDFVKPIRYALVSLREVTDVPTDVLTLSDGTNISISRDLRQEIRKCYMDYKMKKLLEKGNG